MCRLMEWKIHLFLATVNRTYSSDMGQDQMAPSDKRCVLTIPEMKNKKISLARNSFVNIKTIK